jgi:hypothetical protein
MSTDQDREGGGEIIEDSALNAMVSGENYSVSRSRRTPGSLGIWGPLREFEVTGVRCAYD